MTYVLIVLSLLIVTAMVCMALYMIAATLIDR